MLLPMQVHNLSKIISFFTNSNPDPQRKFLSFLIDFESLMVYDNIAKFGYRSGIYRRYTFK